MARSSGEKYYFVMLKPEKPDLVTQRNDEARKEDWVIYQIYLRDLKRIKEWRGQYSTDLIYNGEQNEN